MLRRLDLRGVDGDLASRLPRPATEPDADDDLLATVRGIIGRVRADGDAALRELTERFDGRRGPLRIDPSEISDAFDALAGPVAEALEVAAGRIRAFHETQVTAPTLYEDGGVAIRSYAKPVRRVGCYVPGGRAAYPSSLLMTVLPARVAGVSEVVVCVPADRSTGGVAPVVLAAAAVAGVDELYAIGGAQAIAAMAYGTATIAPVDVVCGPGNRYVALAQREVAGTVGVASAFAGPSEIVIVADAAVPADFVAIDLMVQAEHGPDGLAWLLCDDPAVADAVDEAIDRLLATAERAEDIRATLASAGVAVVTDSLPRSLDVSNLIAPEHLQLMCAAPERLVPLVENAGAVFCGPWSPASLGDYVAGPSHVLPTHGTARFASALNVGDFVRHHHVIEASREGFEALAPVVEQLATAEGLTTHAESVRLRART